MTEQTNSIVRDEVFYNSHPISKALRELCLEAMIALNRADVGKTCSKRAAPF